MILGQLLEVEQNALQALQEEAKSIASQIGFLEIQKSQLLSAYDSVIVRSKLVTTDIGRRLHAETDWKVAPDGVTVYAI